MFPVFRRILALTLTSILLNGLASSPVLALSFVRTDYATPPDPTHVVLADVNGDGRLDAVLTNQSDPTPVISVFLGDGGGSLGARADYATGLNPISVAVADLNSDGIADLGAAIHIDSGAAVLLGLGDGTFGSSVAYATGLFPAAIEAGDVNGDGRLDLAVANNESHDVSILLGIGDGTFPAPISIPTALAPESVGLADLNADGNLDLVTAGLSNAASIHLGNGNGTFAPRTDYPTGTGQTDPLDLAIGDLNDDGRPDLATANRFTDEIAVFIGVGDGTFAGPTSVPTGDAPRWVEIGDMDGDGRADLVFANREDGSVSVAPGNGDGTFGTRITVAVGSLPFSVSVGDLDRDGDADLAVANQGSRTLSVLLNTTTNSLPVRVFTVGSNRTIRLASGKPTWCLQLEPIGDSFSLPDLSLTSIALISPGTGTVSQVAAIAGKTVIVGDRDRNDVPDMEVCFRKDDLRLLFSDVAGTQLVTATVEGSLVTGERFGGTVDVEVIGSGSLMASILPNPMNREGDLTFRSSSPGRVLIRIYDSAGRLVHTAAKQESASYGSFHFDGRGRNGERLPSGVYFYQVHARGGVATGRFVIAK